MTNLVNVPVEMIDRSEENPRQYFDNETIDNLAASIARLGVLQPILVRKSQIAGRYELIAGERRWRASQRVNQYSIPAIVLELDEPIVAEIRLIENLERDQLNAIEEAAAFKSLLKLLGCTETALAQQLKRSPQYVRSRLDLLHLDPRVQHIVVDQKISLASAVEIARNIQGHEDQFELAKQVVEQALTVPGTIQLIKSHNLALRFKKQNETKKLKMQQRVEALSSQGAVTWQNFDPAQHHRYWDLIFKECTQCERKGQFLRADGVVELVCIDSACFTTLSMHASEQQEQSIRRMKQERQIAFNLILESDTLTIEHLQYLLWSLAHLMEPNIHGWQATIVEGDANPDLWSTITMLSEEQLLTQIVRLTMFYLAGQNNDKIPQGLRRSLMKRFGLPSSVLFDRSIQV